MLRKLRITMLACAFAVTPAAAQVDVPGPLVSTDWLAQNLARPEVVVLQVESREDPYHRAHIPGARLVHTGAIAWEGDPPVRVELRSVAELEEAMESVGVSNQSRVVIYGSRTQVAARLWMTLDYLGHGDRAALLDGGLQKWEEEGRPVESEDPPEVAGASFAASPRAEMLVDAEWILERLENPEMVLIDARPEDEYTGADGGMGGMANPGHIPGAWHLYWHRLVSDDNRAEFLEERELRRLFEATGAGEGSEVVSYCMIGLRASVNYLVGRMLGYDMKFYDGSWHDWGVREDLPYESGSGRTPTR